MVSEEKVLSLPDSLLESTVDVFPAPMWHPTFANVHRHYVLCTQLMDHISLKSRDPFRTGKVVRRRVDVAQIQTELESVMVCGSKPRTDYGQLSERVPEK